MTITRWHTALGCALLLTAGAAASAQSSAPPPRPEGRTPQAEAPATADPVDQPEEPRRYRFDRPIVRIGQGYTLAAADVVQKVVNIIGDVRVDGRVESDVVVVMGSAHFGTGAVIGGSVVVVGGSAIVDPGAALRGDLVVIGGTLQGPEGFSPEGEQVVVGSAWIGHALQNISPWITRGLLWGRLIVPDLPWIWTLVGIFFLVYLVLNAVFDRPVGAAADALAIRPFSAFFSGLLVLILAVPVLAIMAISVIGLAIVPFLLCAVVVAALVGKAAVARAIGRTIVRPEPPEGRFQALAAFVIGFALLIGAYMVPVLGFITWALTSVLGLGAAAAMFRTAWRSERPVRVKPSPAAVAPLPVSDTVIDNPATATGLPEGDPAAFAAAPPLPLSDEVPPRVAYTSGLARFPRAGFLDRLAAFALDCLLVAIANSLLDMDRHDGFFFLLLLAYHIGFWTWKGTTLGGIICSLRVIRTHGAPLRAADAVVRGLASVFSLAALGIGCLWMLQDPEGQTWHDKIAGTLVVKVPRDLVLP